MRSTFDPFLRQMTHPPDASIYEIYHEMAHEVQRRVNSLPFRLWARFNGIRLLGYFANIWIEYDAMMRARHALEWVEAWNADMQKEGWTNLRSHITRKEL